MDALRSAADQLEPLLLALQNYEEYRLAAKRIVAQMATEDFGADIVEMIVGD